MIKVHYLRWVHGRQSPLTVVFNLFPRQQLVQLLIADESNLVDFMRSPESIHEMEEWDPGGEGSHLGNDSHIMCLLDTERADHGKAASTDQHGIGVVAINAESFSSQSPGSNMNDSG